MAFCPSIVPCTTTQYLKWIRGRQDIGRVRGRRATLTELSTVGRAAVCQAPRAVMVTTVYSFTKWPSIGRIWVRHSGYPSFLPWAIFDFQTICRTKLICIAAVAQNVTELCESTSKYGFVAELSSIALSHYCEKAGPFNDTVTQCEKLIWSTEFLP